ncbi:hypothetical protein J2W35_006951, partial [Variovorax boronicumulans]|nr:hypothetical protein [Variovorax boronicumulans]
ALNGPSRLNDGTSSLVFGILVCQLRFHTTSANTGHTLLSQNPTYH